MNEEAIILKSRGTEEPLAHDSKALFGFWVYLMTDCVLFATLFATFAVLRHSTAGGPASKDIINMPNVLLETLLLLTSSFTCGLAMVSARSQDKKQTLFWFAVTFLLGVGFLILELREFRLLILDGHSWRQSAFLSSFFTLVGTHGLHISIGLLWMLVMMLQVSRRGLGDNQLRRLTMLSLFWHFLDVVWIFIFTIVYLMGVRV